MKKPIAEQAAIAAKIVDAMFVGEIPPIPDDATVQTLWLELCKLKSHTRKPKKVEAIRALLEHEDLTGLPIPLLADIIQRVFKRHGVQCDTSDSSIRWYISQKTLEWDIKPRAKKKDTSLDDI